MLRVKFEPTAPVFEGTTTFHALDRTTIVIGDLSLGFLYFMCVELVSYCNVENRSERLPPELRT
jgi:hypothetical protein